MTMGSFKAIIAGLILLASSQQAFALGEDQRTIQNASNNTATVNIAMEKGKGTLFYLDNESGRAVKLTATDQDLVIPAKKSVVLVATENITRNIMVKVEGKNGVFYGEYSRTYPLDPKITVLKNTVKPAWIEIDNSAKDVSKSFILIK
jgi:hypothetical protein